MYPLKFILNYEVDEISTTWYEDPCGVIKRNCGLAYGDKGNWQDNLENPFFPLPRLKWKEPQN